MIYGIIEEDDDRYVKIGITKGEPGDASAIAKRISSLQTGSPRELVCIAAAPGYRDEERALHWKFHAHHVRREWFRREGAVAEWLEQWRVAPSNDAAAKRDHATRIDYRREQAKTERRSQARKALKAKARRSMGMRVRIKRPVIDRPDIEEPTSEVWHRPDGSVFVGDHKLRGEPPAERQMSDAEIAALDAAADALDAFKSRNQARVDAELIAEIQRNDARAAERASTKEQRRLASVASDARWKWRGVERTHAAPEPQRIPAWTWRGTIRPLFQPHVAPKQRR